MSGYNVPGLKWDKDMCFIDEEDLNYLDILTE